MCNILITGASGFLGRTLVDSLSAKNNVVTLSRNSGDYKLSLEDTIPVFKQNFDLVIHAAGKAHMTPKGINQKAIFFKVNVDGTQNLLKGFDESHPPKHFVFISSVSVYGLEEGLNINENYPLLAKDAYGLSKLQAELLVQNWCKNKNIVCTILRLPLIIGKNPPGNLGAMIKSIKKGYYFNIGDGLAKKSMVTSEDIAKFIPSIAIIGGIYNLTDGYNPNFKEISFAIGRKKMFSIPKSIAKILGFIGDILGDKAPLNTLKLKKINSELTFDDSKARIYGWQPESVLSYLEKNKLF